MDELWELLAIRQKMGHTLHQLRRDDDCVTDWDWVFMPGEANGDWQLRYIPVYPIAEHKYSVN
jgi:hypothetical protein